MSNNKPLGGPLGLGRHIKTGKDLLDNLKQTVNANKKEQDIVKRQQFIELLKTIAITALIAAILAFFGGIEYQNVQENQAEETALSNIRIQK